MTVLVDRAIALLGRAGTALDRGGTWLPWAVIGGLVVLSLLPALVVGSTKQPTEISLADLEAQRIPAVTSWFRLEGDLQEASHDGGYWYRLVNPKGGRGVTVVSTAPLPTGSTEVTGRISPETPLNGTFQSIAADVPTVPARHDPWPLFALPAVAALGLLVGRRAGYPVARRDRAPAVPAQPLAPGERLQAWWSGRITTEVVPIDSMHPCSISVVQEGDICQLTIHETGPQRTVPVRQAGFQKRIRICRTSGCNPAVEVHGQSGDLILVFEGRGERDRLVASLA